MNKTRQECFDRAVELMDHCEELREYLKSGYNKTGALLNDATRNVYRAIITYDSSMATNYLLLGGMTPRE
jgi:hypothetical protein